MKGRNMRRVVVIILLMFISSFVWSEGLLQPSVHSQRIGGYTEDIAVIEVSEFLSPEPGGGINLDYSDESLSYKYNIMPTSTRMTTPGLLIGYFDAYITFASLYSGGTLTISHDTMYCTNPGTTDKAKEIDYELAAVFDFETETTSSSRTEFCLASSSHYGLVVSPASSEASSIEIDMRPYGNQIGYIQDGRLYFRIADAFESIATGTYKSTIVVTLESI